jgi:hypothetical protein
VSRSVGRSVGRSKTPSKSDKQDASRKDSQSGIQSVSQSVSVDGTLKDRYMPNITEIKHNTLNALMLNYKVTKIEA